MNKNLETKMNEAALDYMSVKTFGHELGHHGFKAGFRAAHDLMLEDMKKLVEALDAVIEVDRETHKRHPEYEGEWSHYSDIARKSLQEFKEKYGEI